MKSFLSIINPVRSIPHLRIQLPHRSKTEFRIRYSVTEAHSFLASLSEKSPALFVSLIGSSESAEVSTNLYNLLRYTSEYKKVPIYSFLEDHVNGLTYYIATASNFIGLNPFCRIGDLTVATKSYVNVSQLLKYFGVDYKRIGTNESSIWNRHLEATEQEKEFTGRWLNEVENKLKNEIGKNRKISSESVLKLGSKIIHPREALELGLVDEITTLESFKAARYPNNGLSEASYSLRASDPEFSTREIQVLGEMIQWMSMPRVALVAMEDPILEHVRSFVKIVEERMCSHEKMEELDVLVGKLFEKIEGKIGDIGKFVA